MVYGLFQGFGPFEAIIIVVVVLIVFGVGKLPQVGGALGKGIREFRKGKADELEEPKDMDQPKDKDGEKDP